MRTTAASAPAGSPENERSRRRAYRPTTAGWERAAGWKQEPRAGEKKRDFAVRETKRPGDLRGDVIANGGRQDAAHRAEQCAGASRWFGDPRRFEFPRGRRFTLPPGTHRVSAAAGLADGRLAVENRWFDDRFQQVQYGGAIVHNKNGWRLLHVGCCLRDNWGGPLAYVSAAVHSCHAGMSEATTNRKINL